MQKPGPEHRITVRGYTVIVRTRSNGFYVTCPEMPQLGIQDETLAGAVAHAEHAIDVIWATEFDRRFGPASE